jgi:glycogen synthase
MNVLFISNLYPPNVVGGYERLCFDMASALSARNHKISVLTSNYGGLLEDYPGQDVDRSLQLLADSRDIYKSYSASEAQKKALNAHNATVLEHKLAEVRPDVLFVWNLFFLDHSFLNAIQTAGCRTVFLLTDNWMILFLRPAFWHEYFTKDISRRSCGGYKSVSSYPWTVVIRSTLGRLRAIIHQENPPIHGEAIFPSRFMKSLYAQAGFKFRKTAVIPHGVWLMQREDGEYRDRTVPVENGCIRLLFAGRVVEMKGVHTILEALPEIIRGLPKTDVQLTILGDVRDREYVKKIEAMIQRLNLRDKVAFQPTVQESDLFGIFQDYDIFLFPSLYEPFSLTLIHALASGIPVVASDVGGNQEIIFPDRTGLLFSRGDSRSLSRAVLDLAGKPSLRKDLAIEARKVAREFTFQTMVQKVEAYLNN